MNEIIEKGLKGILKTGMIVVLRNGEERIVLKDFDDLDDDVIAGKNGWDFMSYYDKELCMKNKISKLDIVEIKEPTVGGAAIRIWMETGNKAHFKTIWKREDPKKMTISDIEKELGYKIAIINTRKDEC